MNAKNPVGWFEIYVQDLERAKAFYEAVFQLKLTRLNSPEPIMWAFPMSMEESGCSGALVKMEGLDSVGVGTIVYFKCDDCATEEARAREAGARIHKEKFSIGEYGFISLLVDPEGNMIGLHSLQ